MTGEAILNAIAEFPATFGLNAFPGETFRLSANASYVNDEGVTMLYTQRLCSGTWRDFAKSTADELRTQLVVLP